MGVAYRRLSSGLTRRVTEIASSRAQAVLLQQHLPGFPFSSFLRQDQGVALAVHNRFIDALHTTTTHFIFLPLQRQLIILFLQPRVQNKVRTRLFGVKTVTSSSSSGMAVDGGAVLNDHKVQQRLTYIVLMICIVISYITSFHPPYLTSFFPQKNTARPLIVSEPRSKTVEDADTTTMPSRSKTTTTRKSKKDMEECVEPPPSPPSSPASSDDDSESVPSEKAGANRNGTVKKAAKCVVVKVASSLKKKTSKKRKALVRDSDDEEDVSKPSDKAKTADRHRYVPSQRKNIQNGGTE
jgi:hypothetical protein